MVQKKRAPALARRDPQKIAGKIAKKAHAIIVSPAARWVKRIVRKLAIMLSALAALMFFGAPLESDSCVSYSAGWVLAAVCGWLCWHWCNQDASDWRDGE